MEEDWGASSGGGGVEGGVEVEENWRRVQVVEEEFEGEWKGRRRRERSRRKQGELEEEKQEEEYFRRCLCRVRT